MNLKTAAQRLGVHYQTAYKWVRSGRLVAVKVGLSYEISEAALVRFRAEQEALGRVPLPPPPATAPSAVRHVPADERAALLDEIDRMLPHVVTNARPVLETATRRLAEVLGDAVALRVVSDDGLWLEPVAFHHPDPERYAIAGAVLSSAQAPMGQGYGGRVATTGEVIFLPQFPQVEARRIVLPEYRQYLDDFGVYSMIQAPLAAGGEVLGVLAVIRDAPGNPYTPADRDLVVELARRCADALRGARLFARGWQARADVKARLETLLAAGALNGGDAGEVPEEVLADLAEEEDLGVAIHDTDLRVVAVSPGYAALLGYEPEDLVGRSCVDLTPPDDREAEAASFARLLAGELDFVDLETRKLRRDGAVIHCRAHRSVARLPDATPRFLVTVLRPSPAPPGEGD